jgi:uncharacterized protein (DUF433 family)
MEERFAALADEFVARVRAANIGSATEVFLIYHCFDQTGVPLDPIRRSLAPTTRVTPRDNPESARQLATVWHRETIINTIDFLVRHGTRDLLVPSNGQQVPVTVRNFSLEIVQPTDEPSGTNGLPLRADPLPLRIDEGGAVRVGSSRVSLDLIVGQYENGMALEDMVRAYDTLCLSDVYAAIAYYLRHRDEVDVYLKRRKEQAQALQSKIEAEHPRIGRNELLERRSVKEENHAPTGQ